MAVRQDQVRLRLDFITDESQQLAKTLQTTKEYNQQIKDATTNVAKYERELQKTGISEAKRAQLLKNIEAEQRRIATAERAIYEEGKKIEKLDLNKVAPAQLEQRLKQIRQEMKLIADQSSPAFKSLREESQRIEEQFRKIKGLNAGGGTGGGGLLGGLGGFAGIAGRALPLIGGAVAAFQGLKKAVTGASELEQLTISFETFLGSADKAKQVIQDLKDFEVKTPFEAEQVNQAGRALLAFGTTTDELIPTLTQIGDVAAGTGKDFNELVLIYGKAQTQGLIQGEELNQLAEAGVPIYKELSKVLNVSEKDIRKLGEQGKIEFSALQKVFQNLTGEGGKFAGLMEKQSQSIGGLYSTLKSAFGELLTQLGTALAPAIKGILDAAIGLVNYIKPVLIPVFQFLGSTVSFVFESIGSVAKTTAGLFSGLGSGIASLMERAKDIPIIGTYFKVIGAAIQVVRDAFQSLTATFSGIKAAITDLFTNFGQNMGNAYSEARDAVLQDEARQRAEDERDNRQASEAEKQREIQAAQDVARAKADAQKKAREEARKRAEEAFKTQLAAQEAHLRREELLNEIDHINKNVSEQQYQEDILFIKKKGYEAQLQVYKKFGKEQENEALELQKKLAEINQALTIPRTAPVAAIGGRNVGGQVSTGQDNTGQLLNNQQLGEDALLANLRSKFERALITEQEYELRRMELKRAFLAEEIAILQAASQPQVDEIQKREEQKLKVEESIAFKRLENQRVTDEAKARMEEVRLDTFNASVDLAISILGREEAARRKNASVIKAFNIGEVLVNGIAEVQKIFARYAAVPGGQLIALAESAPAIIRRTAAIVKIATTKFAGGGFTGSGFGGADETGFKPAGVVHEGEYVIPKRIVESQTAAPLIGQLERWRTRKYAQGGFVAPGSTDLRPGVASTTSQTIVQPDLMALYDAVQLFGQKVDAMQTEVKARVVVTELEDAQSELNTLRSDAAL